LPDSDDKDDRGPDIPIADFFFEFRSRLVIVLGVLSEGVKTGDLCENVTYRRWIGAAATSITFFSRRE